jgi:hypothetical protein
MQPPHFEELSRGSGRFWELNAGVDCVLVRHEARRPLVGDKYDPEVPMQRAARIASETHQGACSPGGGSRPLLRKAAAEIPAAYSPDCAGAGQGEDPPGRLLKTEIGAKRIKTQRIAARYH